MAHLHDRWQYQQKAESLFPQAAAPVVTLDWFVQPPIPKRNPLSQNFEFFVSGRVEEAPATVSLDWLQQHPIPLRRAPEVSKQQELALGLIPETTIVVSITTGQILPGTLTQYQALAESLYPIVVEQEVSIDWNIQHPHISRISNPLETEASFIHPPEIKSDWDVARENPVRRQSIFNTGGEAFVDFPRVPFDWIVARTENAVRRIYPVGLYQTFIANIEKLPDLSFVQINNDHIPNRITRIIHDQIVNVLFAPSTKLEVFEQLPSFIRRVNAAALGQSVIGEPPSISSIDWNIQRDDPLRKQNTPIKTDAVSPITFEEISDSFAVVASTGQRTPDYVIQYQAKAQSFFTDQPQTFLDWFVQPPNPITLVQIIESATVGGFSPIIPSFAWQIQESDVIRRKHQIVEGGTFTGFIPIIPSIAWDIQDPHTISRPKIVEGIQGYSPFTPAPQVFFDWYVTETIIPRQIRRPIEGGSTSGFVPIIPSFAWQMQEPDVIRKKKFIQEGQTVGNLLPIVSFSWNLPESDLVREPVVRQEGMFTSGEPVEIRIDWIQETQVPPSIKPRLISAVTEIPRPPDISADSWWQQYPDQTRSHRRNPFGGDFRTERIVPEIITFDKWFQQQFNPFIRIKHPPTNVVFPINFTAGIEEIIFQIRDCLFLEEIYENSLLPLPSGFETYLNIRQVSGYEAPIEVLPAPSGWVRQSDIATPWNLAR